MGTPYLKLVGSTFNDVLQMDRPLTVEALAQYVEQWFEKHISSKKFVTRATYNKMLAQKTSAVIRALRALSPKMDMAMEITLRQRIGDKCFK